MVRRINKSPIIRCSILYLCLSLVLFAASLISVGQVVRSADQTNNGRVTRDAVAQRLFAEGEELSSEWTFDSLRMALKKFQDARSHWRAVGNRRQEIHALQSIAETYERISDYQKARAYQHVALVLSRSAGESINEIKSANSLASLCLSLSKKDEALVYAQEALRLSRSLSYSSGEGLALSNLG